MRKLLRLRKLDNMTPVHATYLEGDEAESYIGYARGVLKQLIKNNNPAVKSKHLFIGDAEIWVTRNPNSIKIKTSGDKIFCTSPSDNKKLIYKKPYPPIEDNIFVQNNYWINKKKRNAVSWDNHFIAINGKQAQFDNNIVFEAVAIIDKTKLAACFINNSLGTNKRCIALCHYALTNTTLSVSFGTVTVLADIGYPDTDITTVHGFAEPNKLIISQLDEEVRYNRLVRLVLSADYLTVESEDILFQPPGILETLHSVDIYAEKINFAIKHMTVVKNESTQGHLGDDQLCFDFNRDYTTYLERKLAVEYRLYRAGASSIDLIDTLTGYYDNYLYTYNLEVYCGAPEPYYSFAMTEVTSTKSIMFVIFTGKDRVVSDISVDGTITRNGAIGTGVIETSTAAYDGKLISLKCGQIWSSTENGFVAEDYAYTDKCMLLAVTDSIDFKTFVLDYKKMQFHLLPQYTNQLSVTGLPKKIS